MKFLLQKTFATAGLSALIAVPLFAGPGHAKVLQAPETERPVSVSDMIEMNRFPGNIDYDESGDASTTSVAQYSPDGNRFVFLERRGDLTDDTNEYSLLMWETKDLFSSPTPVRLLTMASSSNRPAIDQVRWLGSQTLLFLGEHPREVHQLYRVDVSTKRWTQLTHSPTNVLSYDYSPLEDRIVYVAEGPPAKALFDEQTRQTGLLVTTESLVDLVTGKAEPSPNVQLVTESMYLHDDQRVRIIVRAIPGVSPGPDNSPIISPDGRCVALKVYFEHVPSNWEQYDDDYGGYIKKIVNRQVDPGHYSSLYQYQIIDLTTGEAKWVLDSPIWGRDSFAWSPDSRSALICGTYLPLASVTGEERIARIGKTYCVEVKVADGDLTKVVSDAQLGFRAWDQNTGDLLFYGDVTRYFKVPVAGSRVVSFHKVSGRWERISDSSSVSEAVAPTITLKEGMNAPPHLVVEDTANHRSTDLFDLNPQFRDLRFGKEEMVKYRDRLGHEWTGGLYYPVDYRRDKRYPLVIQTHEFNPNRFWINGPYTTSYAAQPLAGRHLFVLQLESYSASILKVHASISEVKFRMAEYEGAIDELDRRGLIDRQHVGIMGFSRTCWYVKYMLTHSKYHVAAAYIADGVDFGYLQSVLAGSNLSSEQNYIVGGPFWGASKQNWLRDSPGFNLDKVRTPLYILGPRLSEAIYEAEWFSGLRQLNRPVELVLLEDGDHPLEMPWEIRVGGGTFVVIAGPCSVESREQLFSTAQAVKAAGARLLRGGAYKPRTSPYEFQGLGLEALRLLSEVRKEVGLPVVTEVTSTENVDLICEHADMLQVGARNMQNFALLRRLAKVDKPILLKRGPSASVREWLLAAEYLLSGGQRDVVLCERGIKTFETETRNTLDLAAIALARDLSHLPVIADPSHGTGRPSLIPPMSRAAAALGADGIMVEVHPCPERALSDGPQSLDLEGFSKLMRSLAEPLRPVSA